MYEQVSRRQRDWSEVDGEKQAVDSSETRCFESVDLVLKKCM